MPTEQTDPLSVPGLLTLLMLGLLLYTYAGYPLLLWVVRTLKAPLKTAPGRPPEWPTVTVLISAYNEEGVIARRIQNLLEQEYPKDCLEVLIGSDGSTDRTADAVAASHGDRVRMISFPVRRGKASVLNDLAARATGEFLVFTDAATMFYPDSLKQLMIGFHRYPSAAVIGGKLELRSPESSRNADGLYWRYEMFLKTAESQIGAGLGASGAIYATRRRDYRPLPPRTMADDLLEPLLIRLHTRGHVVLHAPARAWQLTPLRMADEFHRRVRTGSGIAHVLCETWRLLLPKWGGVAWAYGSHKGLRLLGPWMLLAILIGTLWMVRHPLYQGLFAMQAAAYGAALAAGALTPVPVFGKAAVAARYFVVLNAALAVGALKVLFGTARPIWNRTPRPAEPMAPSAAWRQWDTSAANGNNESPRKAKSAL